MREWKIKEQTTGVEDAGVEKAEVNPMVRQLEI